MVFEKFQILAQFMYSYMLFSVTILTLKIGVYESTSKNSGAANIWSWVMSRTILESTCPELSKKNYSGSKAQWEHFQPTNTIFLLQYMTIPVLTILWERKMTYDYDLAVLPLLWAPSPTFISGGGGTPRLICYNHGYWENMLKVMHRNLKFYA